MNLYISTEKGIEGWENVSSQEQAIEKMENDCPSSLYIDDLDISLSQWLITKDLNTDCTYLPNDFIYKSKNTEDVNTIANYLTFRQKKNSNIRGVRKKKHSIKYYNWDSNKFNDIDVAMMLYEGDYINL